MLTFPFFVGCARSGTTLVTAMFNAHPDCAIPFETHFLPHVLAAAARQPSNTSLDLAAFEATVKGYESFRKWKLGELDVHRALWRDPPVQDHAEAMRRLFGAYAQPQSTA